MQGLDALLPVEIARKAESIGAQKTRLDALSLFVPAILAGAFIGFGAMFATTVLAGADGVLPFGVDRRQDPGGRLSGIGFRCRGFRTFGRQYVSRSAWSLREDVGTGKSLDASPGRRDGLRGADMDRLLAEPCSRDHRQYHWRRRTCRRGLLVRLSAQPRAGKLIRRQEIRYGFVVNHGHPLRQWRCIRALRTMWMCRASTARTI